VCGAPIDAAHVAEELAQWAAEMAHLDGSLGELQERQAKLQASLGQQSGKEREQLERVAQFKKQREKLTELEASLARRQKEWEDAIASEKGAFAAVRTEAEGLTSVLEESSLATRWNLEGEPGAVIASIHDTIQALRQSLAERVGRQVAQRQALTELLGRFDNQTQSLKRRQSELEREQASTMAEANTQQTKASRAARLRRLSAGFKELQVTIRSEAATKLAADTLGPASSVVGEGRVLNH